MSQTKVEQRADRGSESVAVVGSGIIGISIGLRLQQRGYSVCLYDREPLASDARASAGNAGAFAFTDVMPLATPGIMRRAPKWLIDPLGPLSIPPRYALKIAPWMLRFWRASQRDRYAAGVAAQSRPSSYTVRLTCAVLRPARYRYVQLQRA